MSATQAAARALLRGEARVDRHLVVKSGPDAGRTFPLRATQTLGRGREADLRLTDPAASRLHVRITRSEGRILLADLRSKNGVQVNGRRFRGARPLAVGDELRIGASSLTLEPGLLDERELPPPPPTARADGRLPGARGLQALLAGALALLSAAALLLALP